MATPPDFVPADAQQIITDLVARYELITGKTLYPGHVDRAMLDGLMASSAAPGQLRVAAVALPPEESGS